jgi:hypothetical protein
MTATVTPGRDRYDGDVFHRKTAAINIYFRFGEY